MIFKKLFRPKYQDPNPQIRIQAIQTLSPDESQHKAQLHELAFNDEDPNVNLAALKRLNSFALWCKMAETAKVERVRKKAQSTVETALFEQSELEISEKDRITFVKECKSPVLLEKLITLPWLQSDNVPLMLSTLHKIGKPYVLHKTFLATSSESLQLALLENIDDVSVLQKALKRTPFEPVKQAIADKLANIELHKTRPAEVEKSVKLILSQLLALRDKRDYALLTEQREKLTSQYLQAKQDFHFLSQDIAAQFEQRYADIQQKLDHTSEQLLPEWQSRKQLEAVKLSLSQTENSIHAIIEQVNHLLGEDASKITLGEVERYQVELQEAERTLTGLSTEVTRLTGASHLLQGIESLFAMIRQCTATLERLPEFQNAIADARLLIKKLSKLPLPSDISQIEASEAHFNEQREQWRAIVTPYKTNWPDELTRQWQDLSSQWKNAIRGLTNEVKQSESRVRGKLKAVDSLISQGKFKAAMGLFSKVASWYQALPEKQQALLSRSFDNTKEQVENLHDWQQYIAVPRKPAMLREVEAIALQPLEVKQQSEEVKRLRSAWSSLGATGTEADDALNFAFDLAIEKAFEPCREHYNKLDKEREDNLLKKRQVIEDMCNLNTQEADPKALTDSFTKLQKRWKEIGGVDYKVLESLNADYRAAAEPLKQKVATYQQDNADQKQALLKQAIFLLDSDDVTDAIEQAKTLQRKWKQIGHAGHKAERQLWTAFRKTNDELFEKRQSVFDAQRQQTDTLRSEIDQALEGLEQSIQQADELSKLDECMLGLTELSDKIAQLPEKLVRSYHNKVANLTDKLQRNKQELVVARKSQVYVQLFESLKQWQQPQVPESVKALPNGWQQSFTLATDGQFSRHEVTLLLEIIAQATSPPEDQALRKSLQLGMMTNKLEKGEELERDSLLALWIEQGPLSESDLDLLKRVEALYQ